MNGAHTNDQEHEDPLMKMDAEVKEEFNHLRAVIGHVRDKVEEVRQDLDRKLGNGFTGLNMRIDRFDERMERFDKRLTGFLKTQVRRRGVKTPRSTRRPRRRRF